MSSRKTCVITSTGKRVCGRRVSAASGATLAEVSRRRNTPLTVSRQFEYMIQRMEALGFSVHHREMPDSYGRPSESISIWFPTREVELVYGDGRYTVYDALHENRAVSMGKPFRTFHEAALEFDRLAKKYDA